jgi:hypothetical protein
MPTTTTCREEVLDAMASLMRRHGRTEFKLDEIVQEVLGGTDAFKESTIRTHVTSRMCANAPDHHGTVYADLERTSRGYYRLRSKQ